jgi:hypothetical protein
MQHLDDDLVRWHWQVPEASLSDRCEGLRDRMPHQPCTNWSLAAIMANAAPGISPKGSLRAFSMAPGVLKAAIAQCDPSR